MSYYIIAREDYLMHHGVKGQKWGVRRWQNEDGSLTPEGIKKYGTVDNFNYQRARKKRIARNVGIGVGASLAVGLGSAAFLNSKAGQNLKDNIRSAAKLRKELRGGTLDDTYNRLNSLMDYNSSGKGNSRTRTLERTAKGVFNAQVARRTAFAKAKGAIQGAYEYATDKDNGAQKVMSDAVKQAGKTAVTTAVQSLAGKGTKMVTEAALGAISQKGKDYVSKRFGEGYGSYMFQNPNKKQ